MGIDGIGSSFSYWYDARTGRISGENGEMDDFTRYFNGDVDAEDEGYYYNQAVKEDIESIIQVFSSSTYQGRIYQEEKALFQIKGQIVDSGCTKYTVNGRYSFEGRFGELTYDPEQMSLEFAAGARGETDRQKVLGIGFLENPQDGIMYGMSASYANESAADDPVIRVTVMTAGEPEEYDIHVNQINVENATEIQMFALCCYMDSIGQGTGGKFGSWQTLNYFRHNAGYNGYFKMSNTTELSAGLRQNWFGMVTRMNADYEGAGLEKQVEDGRSLMEMLREHMNHMYIDGRIMNEKPSFSIGSSSYTEEEWEKFIEYVDFMLDSGSEKDEKREREKEGTDTASKTTDIAKGIPVQSIEETAIYVAADDGLFLTNETSQCSYPAEKKGEDDIRYIVCYTQDGIICKKAGEREAVWQMEFYQKGDYDRVIAFLQNFEAGENLRFTAHKKFWQDFLSGNMGEEDFLDFFGRTENGIPNYLLTTEDGVYVDRENLKYQKYFTHNSIANPESELPDFVGTYLKNPSEFIAWQEEHQKRTFNGEKPEDAFLTWYYQKNPSAEKKQNPYYGENWMLMAEAFDQWKRELTELFEENERKRQAGHKLAG